MTCCQGMQAMLACAECLEEGTARAVVCSSHAHLVRRHCPSALSYMLPNVELWLLPRQVLHFHWCDSGAPYLRLAACSTAGWQRLVAACHLPTGTFSSADGRSLTVTPAPHRWQDYKTLVQRWFPGGIWDTKHLACQLPVSLTLTGHAVPPRLHLAVSKPVAGWWEPLYT